MPADTRQLTDLVCPPSEVIAGRRRLAALRKLGWATIPVTVVAGLDDAGLDDALLALKAERVENVCRVAMSPIELVELGKKIEALEKPEAQKRKEAGRGRPRPADKIDEIRTRLTDQGYLSVESSS